MASMADQRDASRQDYLKRQLQRKLALEQRLLDEDAQLVNDADSGLTSAEVKRYRMRAAVVGLASETQVSLTEALAEVRGAKSLDKTEAEIKDEALLAGQDEPVGIVTLARQEALLRRRPHSAADAAGGAGGGGAGSNSRGDLRSWQRDMMARVSGAAPGAGAASARAAIGGGSYSLSDSDNDDDVLLHARLDGNPALAGASVAEQEAIAAITAQILAGKDPEAELKARRAAARTAADPVASAKSKFDAIQVQRKLLPAYAYRDELLQMVRQHQVRDIYE